MDNAKACRSLCLSVVFLLICPAQTGRADDVSPVALNVVLIVADNQNPDTLGAYGNAEFVTPSIDRLAAEGMTFNNAFAVSGVCSPSRASLLTGLLPSQNGVHNGLPADFAAENWSAIEEFRNLPQTLSDAGYRSGFVGKYHLGQPDEAQLGFDYWVTFPSGHTTTFQNVSVIDNTKTYRAPGHLTDFWTRKAIEFIGEQSKGDERPFFLFLSYNGPYNLPPVVLEESANRYADHFTKNPPSFPQEPVHPYLRNWSQDTTPTSVLMKNYRNEDEPEQSRDLTLAWQAIQALNNTTAIISLASETAMVDDGVGKVMDALRVNGFDKNTLVIYTSDQGSSYGQHGLWGNSSWAVPVTAYDENMKVPLIVRHPGRIPAGTENDRFINQYDLLPTVLEYVGMQDRVVKDTPGKSFVESLHGKNQENWDDVAFFEYITTRAIRTPRWKYVKRILVEPATELYDLRLDPAEGRNVVHDDMYSEVVDRLDNQLTEFFDQYSEPDYDPWKGGSAKAILMYGDQNQIFEEHFENWQAPAVEKVVPFSDK